MLVPDWLPALLIALVVLALVVVVLGAVLAASAAAEARASYLSDEPWLDWDGEVPPELQSGGEKFDVPPNAYGYVARVKRDG